MGGQEVRNALSKNIKLFRGNRSWSQADLAEKAGISIPFLSDIERGNKWPYPDTLSNLAKALDVEVFELFKLEKPMEGEEFPNRLVKEILIAVNNSVEKVCKQYLKPVLNRYLLASLKKSRKPAPVA
jgi:transcriptional regulator with XRE-family HTH domain